MESIVIALIGSGFLSALISGVVTIVTKQMDKKSNRQDEISQQIKSLAKDVKDVATEVKTVRKELNDFKEESDQDDAENVRYRLLRFADEIRHGTIHSEEHFLQIRQDITKYEKYCASHPNFPNEVANSSIALIRKTYETCSERQSFL